MLGDAHRLGAYATAPNPVLITPGQVLTAAALTGLGLLFASQARAAGRRPGTAPPSRGELPSPVEEACVPYRFDRGQVQQEVEGHLQSGERDPSVIATNIATDLFGQHPDGFAVVFPPAPDARVEVKCVFDRILAAVDEAFERRGLEPGDVGEVGDAVVWRTVQTEPGSPDLADYPWNDAVVSASGVPAPGTFYQVVLPDSDNEVIKKGLASALAMAGLDPDLAFDPSSKVARRLRREMRELLLCSPFNDGRLTSTSATFAGGRDPGANGPQDQGVTYMMGPHGRGLVWLPRHHDDMARLALGLPAKRAISAEGRPLGSGRSQMLIWWPAINLDALRGSEPVVTTEGMFWPDSGKNTLHPPTVVDRLGVARSGVELGCVGCEPQPGVGA